MATPPHVRPPTIHDVARVAKLSKSTVSNVIRNAVGVHPQTRERVQAAIAELGYQTNIVARQLVQQRTTVLGIVIGDLMNPFHAEMAKLIEGLTASRGYQVMFCNTRTDEDTELAGIRSMLEHRVAGLLFLCCRNAAESTRHLVAGRVPAVFVGCSAGWGPASTQDSGQGSGRGWGDVVAVDDAAGAKAAIAYLIAEGHRQIWHYAGDARDRPAACDRALGYHQAMKLAGLAPVTFRLDSQAEMAVVMGKAGDKAGDALGGEAVPLDAILAGANAPTAIFAVNDACALQIIEIAERLGIAVPERLSVVGFDDASCAGHARLGLTTVAQPKETMAHLAVETLVRRVSGDTSEALCRQILDFQFVVRSSTAPPWDRGQPVRGYSELVSA